MAVYMGFIISFEVQDIIRSTHAPQHQRPLGHFREYVIPQYDNIRHNLVYFTIEQSRLLDERYHRHDRQCS